MESSTINLGNLTRFLTGNTILGYVGETIHNLYLALSAWDSAGFEYRMDAVDAASAEFGISVDAILRFAKVGA